MVMVTKESIAQKIAADPEAVLQNLLIDFGNHALAERSHRNLIKLHEICRKQYESGSLDFSAFTLAGLAANDPRKLYNLYKLNYFTLIEAWATFAGGTTRNLTLSKRERDRSETVDYLNTYFQQNSRLPDWKTLSREIDRRFEYSESVRLRHTYLCVEMWKAGYLVGVAPDIPIACDHLFDTFFSVPSSLEVRKSLPEPIVSLNDAQLASAIERWRQCRFSIELWKFMPSHPKAEFEWLALHPELSEWRPIVCRYLSSLISEHVRRPARLGLHDFFANFLLTHNQILSLNRFLSDTKPTTCFADVLKRVSPKEAHRRWRASYQLIEYVLDHAEGFSTVDEHGHRTRAAEFQNPLLPLYEESEPLILDLQKKRLPKGSLQDSELKFITDITLKLEQWRIYAAEWMASVTANLSGAQNTIREFIVGYIVNQRLPTDPAVLLSVEWQQANKMPIYVETALENRNSKNSLSAFSKAVEFIEYVLNTYFSAEDDYGRRTVSGDYCNFLVEQTKSKPSSAGHLSKSNKDVLPSRYIRYLRELICPDGATYFRHLEWAHNASPQADWFEVCPDIIDKDDPDCVWRVRVVYKNSRNGRNLNKTRTIHEIWSPVRAIALMLKLELPLRTLQVRMLDSGEGDTWRYEGSVLEKNKREEWTYRAGNFVRNEGILSSQVGKTERHAGIFRRMPDTLSGKIFSGLYINTNKTQDRGKDHWDRGYVVPWQHGKVLYWCERLRNWQEKYNAVDGLATCELIPDRVLKAKAEIQKQQMGKMVFLFRDPCSVQRERRWPITDGKLALLWERALQALEEICTKEGHTGVDGSPLRFVEVSARTGQVLGFYSLHSLRVSLITHLATEGGVEMHILSECIAGHARILMTLYYKKSGVVYVSEAMDAASERLKESTTEQKNWVRWMKEATLKQMEVNSASVDESVLQAVKDSFAEGGSRLLRTNLGLCAKGGMGCDTGGIIVDEDTGVVSYGNVPGYPQQKNCVRCRWFLTGPAFLLPLVHHWNVLHFNLGHTGKRFLEMSQEVAELESDMLQCQRTKVPFAHETRLTSLRHELNVIYDGNEKLASDSLATMKLIVRCRHIIDASKQHDSGVVLLAVGGIEDVTITVRECCELEQVLTAAVGAMIFVDEDVHSAVLKAGNAYDRMLAMNGKEPVFFKLSERELPIVVSHMTRLLQAYAGSISRAVPFVEGTQLLSALGLFGDSAEILRWASAGTPLSLIATDEDGPILISHKSEASGQNLNAIVEAEQ